MIRLYTDRSVVGGRYIIKSIDAAFNVDISGSVIDDVDEEIMYELDSAKLFDRSTDAIITPFGGCFLRNLSTGCKTIIYARHMIMDEDTRVLNANECGANAFDLLCRYIDNSDLSVFMNIYSSIKVSNKYTFLIDDKYETSSFCEDLMGGRLHVCSSGWR